MQFKIFSSSVQKTPTSNIGMNYLQTRMNTYVKTSPSRSSKDEQRGAVAVEAAVGLPFFLAIILTSFQLLVFCFQLLSFQYSVTNETTRVFLNQTGSTLSWQEQLEGLIGAEGNRLSLCPANTTQCQLCDPGGVNCNWPADAIEVQYLCNGVTCTENEAGAGDLAKVTVRFTKPFFRAVQNIGLDPLTMQISAVSGILRDQT